MLPSLPEFRRGCSGRRVRARLDILRWVKQKTLYQVTVLYILTKRKPESTRIGQHRVFMFTLDLSICFDVFSEHFRYHISHGFGSYEVSSDSIRYVSKHHL